MLNQNRWCVQASKYFSVHRVAGGARCVGSNLVADGHTNMVVGPGQVTIAVNNGAMELVANLGRIVNVQTINVLDGPIFSSDTTAALGAPTATFSSMAVKGDRPDR